MDKPHLYCTVWNIMVNMVSHKKYTLYMFQHTHNMSEYGLHLVCNHTKKKESKETNIIPTSHVKY